MIFGSSRIPELGRGIGEGIRNFKNSFREGAGDKEARAALDKAIQLGGDEAATAPLRSKRIV